MNQKHVAAVIVVFLCFCLSFGTGDKRIEEARRRLRMHHFRLLHYMKNPNSLRPQSTIYMYLKNVHDMEKTWQNWVQVISGYSPEQLSIPASSFRRKDVLKLATEFHLWQTGWYHIRFISLDKAANRDKHIDDGYPRTYKCRDAAAIARNHSEDHKKMYLNYHKALGKKARQDIMKELVFPNYIDSRVSLNHQYAEIDSILNFRFHLEKHTLRLLKRKACMSLKSVKRLKFIQDALAPSVMALNDDMRSRLPNSFPVEDLSQPPDKACRSDREFLEVAWLFNRHRSLWYEIRHYEFLKFLRHRKQRVKPEFIERVNEAVEFTSKLFHQYESLYKDYYKVFVKHQADNTPHATAFVEVDGRIHISDDEGLEQIQWRGNRKRTTFKRIRGIVSPKSLEIAKNKLLDETVLIAQNIQSASHFIEVDRQIHMAEDEGLEQIRWSNQRKRSKMIFSAVADATTENQYFDEKVRSNKPALSRCEAQPKLDLKQALPEADKDSCLADANPLFIEVAQHCTKAVPVDFDLRSGTSLGEAEPGITNEEVAMKLPEMNLNELPPETEEDLCLVDVLLELHANRVSCASENNQQLHDTIEMNCIATKRL